MVLHPVDPTLYHVAVERKRVGDPRRHVTHPAPVPEAVTYKADTRHRAQSKQSLAPEVSPRISRYPKVLNVSWLGRRQGKRGTDCVAREPSPVLDSPEALFLDGRG